MKRLIFLLSLILLMPQTCVALQATFNKQALVADAAITLGDVVEFSEQNDLALALASQTVGQAGAPGQTVHLRSQAIIDYLSASQQLPDHLSWAGAPVVAVSRAGQVISSQRILALIEEFLEERQADLPEADIRFIPQSLPIPFTLPSGELEWEVIPSHPKILGSSRFSLIFRVDGKVVKNMSVRGDIEAIAEVVVSAQTLKRGRLLRPGDMVLASQDISANPDASFSINELYGMKLKRGLKANSVITASMVEPLPVVRKGQKVKIILSQGGLTLTATGLSHTDGHLNQMIQVQNLASQKIIYARVMAPGIVEVLL